ncbi:MAG: type II secretion system F family protein [bacterium]
MYLRYQAYTPQGDLIQGTLSASSTPEAIAALHKQGLYIVHLTEPQEGCNYIFKLARFTSSKRRLPLKAVVIFLRQLSSLIRAGLPLMDCLEVLEQEAFYPALSRVCARVREGLIRGHSLSGALESQGIVFPPLVVPMTRAAEATGKLAEVYKHLAVAYERELKLRERLWTAAAYPFVVLALALVVCIVMVKFVLPQFLTLVTGSDIHLPRATSLLLAFAETKTLFTVLFALLFLVVAFALLTNTPRGAYYKDFLLLQLPIVGSLLSRMHLARLCRGLSLCLANGIALAPALDIVKGTAANRFLQDQLEIVKRGLQSGQRLADLLAHNTVFPGLVVQMARIGEESGRLKDMLLEVANFYDQEVENSIVLLSALAEPTLIILVGGVVGFVVLALALPLITMSSMVM